ncbi:GNAT family N-acetyltransferase [Lysinibacillus pakistanensis]
MLESERLILVNYTEDDISFLENLLSNPNMVRYIGNGEVRNREQANKFFEWIIEHYKLNRNYGLKLIKDKVTGKKIGHAGLVPQIVEEDHYIEVGYWIEENYWGKGYASEVALALIDYGLNELKLPKIIALIQNGNIASEKVAIKNGLKKEKEILLNEKIVSIYTT